MATVKLTPRQQSVVDVIRDNDGEANTFELTQCLGTPANVVHRMLNALAEKGVVTVFETRSRMPCSDGGKYVVATLVEHEDEDDELDDVISSGREVAYQDWDSAGPGAGAGRVSVYLYKGGYFVLHDAGLDGPLPTLASALESGGIDRVNEATVEIWDEDRGYTFQRK